MRTRLSALFCALLLAVAGRGTLVAQDAGLPGEYLNYGGYRALGMGRAYTAIAEGPEAVFWNPAGLGFLRPHTLSMTHSRTLEEFTVSSLFYGQPIFRSGAIAVGYIRQDSGHMALTDQLNRSLGSYSDIQQTAAAAYGVQVLPSRSRKRWLQSLAVGAAAKYSNQSLYTAKAGAWGLDAGLLAKFKRDISFGLRVQNLVQPALKFETATDTFPRSVTAGLAAAFWRGRLTLSLDASKALGKKQDPRYNIGVEGLLRKQLRLRGGFDVENKETILGLAYLFGRSEAAYTSNISDAGYSHNMGLSHEFGGFPVTVVASPEVFSPIGLRKYTTFTVKVSPEIRVFAWTLYIRDQSGSVARSFMGTSQPPPELTWDGSTQGGSVVAAGNYIYTMEITSAEGRKETTPPQTLRVVFGTPMDRLYEPTSK